MISISKRFPAYVFFLSLGTFITFAILLASPSDPKNAVFLGYSIERTLLGVSVLLIGFSLLFTSVYLLRRRELSMNLWADITQPGRAGDFVLVIFLLMFLSGSAALLMPSYRLGRFASYITTLSPIIIWLTIASILTVVLTLIERKGINSLNTKTTHLILKVGFVVFGISILLILFILSTGIGIRFPSDYWYNAGVPVLGFQVLLSLFVGTLFLFFERRFNIFKHAKIDFVLFILIWVLAAWFWGRGPLNPNYFMPDTAKNVIYPYSDAATFDQGGQFALIGQSLLNGLYSDRPLYSIFLLVLHLVFGQDYVILMTAQAALFAVFPAVIYLIGNELHSRALGISASVLIAIRGVNAIIAAKWIDTASPKMMLTDFPTAIGISIFILLILKWMKHPSRLNILIWAGAVFGLALMIRSHVLPLLPVVLICSPLFLRIRWKQVVLVGLLVIVGMLTVTLPWEVRNSTKGIPMFYTYYSRIEILLRYRYGIGADASTHSETVNALNSSDSFYQVNTHALLRQRSLTQAGSLTCESVPCSLLNHLLHNTITSVISLPATPVFHDLWNTIKSDLPYWKKSWKDGFVDTVGSGMIILNIALISLGVGSIWERKRAIALLPIVFFMTYLFTNSLGLTSGGRYIAPVDWLVLLYYMAGGIQLLSWLLRFAGVPQEDYSPASGINVFPELRWGSYASIIPVLGAILALGALLPVSEMFFEPRYQIREPEKILSELEETGLLEQSGFTRAELLTFLSQPNAMIREGRALYPRYYPSGAGEPDRSTYYRFLDYQRLVFTLIGPYSGFHEGVVIPGNPPPISFHAADVVVLGCLNTSYFATFIDAVVVFTPSDGGYVYNRSPGSPLQCPLPEPK